MLEREIMCANPEFGWDFVPPEEDTIGASIVLKAIRGERVDREVVDGLDHLWKLVARAILEFAVNRYSRLSPQKQREKYLVSLFKSGLYDGNVDILGEIRVNHHCPGTTATYTWSRANAAFQIKYAIEYVLQNEGPAAFLQIAPEFDPLKGGFEHAWSYFDDDGNSGPDWIVEDVLVRDATTVIGGPIKSLKTYILVDLMISLASGTPFLGRWAVPAPVRTLLIAGEGSKWSLKHRVQSICKAKGIPGPRQLDMLLGHRGKLPNVNSPEAMDRLCEQIVEEEIEVIAIDPLYLAVGLSGDTGANHNDMFSMGNALTAFANAILAAGATPIVCHHFTRMSGRQKARDPELSDLAHAGIAEFARQWILVNRRGRYGPNSAIHKLRMNLGGYTHGATYDVDFLMERDADGLWGWDVRFASDRAEALATPAARCADARPVPPKADAVRTAVMQALASGPATARQIRDASGLSNAKVRRALEALEGEGVARPAKVSRPMGKGSRTCDGYELTGNVGPSRAATGP